MKRVIAMFFRIKGYRKGMSAVFICFLLTGFLTGCGETFKADCDTLYIQKNGTVISASIEDFNKDYYNEEELKNFVEERVTEYQEKHGENSVKMDNFSVEDGIANLYIKYDGYENYRDFNEVTFFSGTIPQALAEGFDFNVQFTEIQDKAAAGTVDNRTIVDTDCKVIILNEKVDVKVDGTIRYMSSEYTTIKGEDTVSIKLPDDAGDGEELSLVYIVYN